MDPPPDRPPDGRPRAWWTSAAGGRLCSAKGARAGDDERPVVQAGSRRAPTVRAHRRPDTALGCGAMSTSGSFWGPPPSLVRCGLRREPGIGDLRATWGACANSDPGVAAASGRVSGSRRISDGCGGGGTPKRFGVAMRRLTVQGRATTGRWAGPVASAEEPAIVVTLRPVGGGDGGPSASKVEGRGVESPRPIRMGRWASVDQARSSARRRERRGARRAACRQRRRRRRGPPGLAYPGVGRAREVRW